MTKSELIDRLAARMDHLTHRDVDLAVRSMLERMSRSLAEGERIEVRGFGSFSLRFRPSRMGRNPRTGAAVPLPDKHVVHFKPGRALRERVDRGAGRLPSASGSNDGRMTVPDPAEE